MKTITVTPKNEEVIPLLEHFFSNSDLVSDFQINENGMPARIPNKETLEAIREVEEGDLIEIGTFEDYLEWSKNV